MPHKPPRKTYRVKGPFRILNFTLTGRPIFVSHSIFKKLMSEAGGRLDLAGKPLSVDIEFNIKFEETAFWRGEAVSLIRDLDTYPVKGLAPGVVAVTDVRSQFMFYGNCWFGLSNSHIVKDDPSVVAGMGGQ